MGRAEVHIDEALAGILEKEPEGKYAFCYREGYAGPPLSLAMPTSQQVYLYDAFPPFFDGLLPEGMMLNTLLRERKLDRSDFFGQLVELGEDLPGNVTVRGVK